MHSGQWISCNKVRFDLGRLGLAAHDDSEAARLLAEASEDPKDYSGEDSADVGVFAAVLGGIRNRHKDFAGAAASYKMAFERFGTVWEMNEQGYRGCFAR